MAPPCPLASSPTLRESPSDRGFGGRGSPEGEGGGGLLLLGGWPPRSPHLSSIYSKFQEEVSWQREPSTGSRAWRCRLRSEELSRVFWIQDWERVHGLKAALRAPRTRAEWGPGPSGF